MLVVVATGTLAKGGSMGMPMTVDGTIRVDVNMFMFNGSPYHPSTGWGRRSCAAITVFAHNRLLRGFGVGSGQPCNCGGNFSDFSG